MTDTTIVTIAVAALAALPPTIAALAALRQSKATDKKTEEVIKKTVENTEVTQATLATVDRVETQTNGHLSVMTVNVQQLETKLEMALKQNTDLQSTNASIVEMMKSLLEAEANDKKDIVRAIETNGTKSGTSQTDAKKLEKLDKIQETTTEILLQQSVAKLADGGQLDEMQETGDESHAMLKDQAKATKKKP